MPLGELINEILTTPKGILFLLIGNTAGAVIAMAVFSFSVTSFPMLYHRDVDFITAMIISVRLVRKNPRPMVFLGYDNRHDDRPVAAFRVLWPVHGTAGSGICVLASVSPRRPNQRR